MSRIRNLNEQRLLSAEMGLDGIEHLEAGETLDSEYASRVTSGGSTRVTSTGATRGVAYDYGYEFTCWWKIVPAIKSETVVFDAGCEVLIGEPPQEDDTATAAEPVRAPLTRVVTKASGGNAHAYRLR